MIFLPQSKIRRACYRVVSSKLMSPTTLTLILLQTVLLAYRQWNPYNDFGYIGLCFIWIDYAIFAINCVYTVEILAKIIAFGLIDDRIMLQTLGLRYPRSKVSRACKYEWGIIYENM